MHFTKNMKNTFIFQNFLYHIEFTVETWSVWISDVFMECDNHH